MKQKSFKNRLKSLKDSIFHRSDKNEKSKILEGFEGTDFTREEQVKYTNSHYIAQAVKELEERNNTKYRAYIPLF